MLKLEGVKGFNEVLKSLTETSLPTMTVVRVPFHEQRALPEAGFDIIVSSLSAENAATTQCVFSSQLGSGRSTLGMVIASIVKAAQMMTKLHKMVEAGMAEKTWAEISSRASSRTPCPVRTTRIPS